MKCIEKQIHNILNYVKINCRVPKCEKLNISQDRLNSLVKKCNKYLLLDKDYVYVNIIGQVQSNDDADMEITPLGLKFLEKHNPVGNIKK